MDIPTFVPKRTQESDVIGRRLFSVARSIAWISVALLPLVCIPALFPISLASKTLFMVFALALVVILASLAVLRDGQISWRPSPLFISWWMVVLSAGVAGIMAPQMQVAFVGETIDIHTVGFLVVAGVLMTVMQLFRTERVGALYLYTALLGSALVLGLFHILRILVGSDVLTLGFLNESTANVLGSFNDLALFFALAVLLGLIAVIQLSLPNWLKNVVVTAVVLSICMLTVINFSIIWLVLGLVSLLLLMYTLTKGRFGSAEQKSASVTNLSAVLLITFVFLTSAFFVVGGQLLGEKINQQTGVSYVEVRPSMTATFDIMRSVYGTNALTGAGPNHFAEAWTTHKDQSINQTLFWNTNFSAGNGYIPTWFVTGGLLAVVAWLVFFGLLVWTGIQTLLRPVEDTFAYFLTTVSFVTAMFVWGISFVYVPGPVILLLGAASTGLFIAMSQAISPRPVWSYNLLTNVRTGFILITIVMVVIIGSIAVGYYSFRIVLAVSTYGGAFSIPTSETQATEVSQSLASAYSYYQSDVYVRDLALVQLAQIRQLLATENAGSAEQQQLAGLVTSGLQAAEQAIRVRASDARNWQVRADIYAVLASANVEGAMARATEDYTEAAKRDPQNPYYPLQRSVLALREDNEDEARRLIGESLSLKPNYTDALFLLSQLDIATGNIDEAIRTTESLISIEVGNPGRYYQLGVLHSANNNPDNAIAAFSQALQLNPQYANARYLRALEYAKKDDTTTALSELAIVRDLNADNAVTVNALMEQIENGTVTSSATSTTPIAEPATDQNNSTTNPAVPESDLLTPVNAVNQTTASTSATVGE